MLANFRRSIVIYTIIVLGLFVTIHNAWAQTATKDNVTLGVAKFVDVKAKNIKDGTIISASEKGAIPSILAYDPQVIGVVARDAAILLNYQSKNSGVPVISTGQVYMLVSSKEGPIKTG